MKARDTRPTLDDIASILDDLEQRSPAGARRVQMQIKATIDLVVEHPFLGTTTDDPSIRRIAAAPSAYLVFFEATSSEEIIIHTPCGMARETWKAGARGGTRQTCEGARAFPSIRAAALSYGAT